MDQINPDEVVMKPIQEHISKGISPKNCTKPTT